MRITTTIKPVILGLSALVLAPSVLAMDFTASGFLSVVAGKVLGGEQGDYLQNVAGYDCPCFVADYPNVGIYEGNNWDFSPDSRAGIQVNALFNESLGFTTQVVGHGGDNMKPELSAMYLSYQFNNELSMSVGRQRLPLFYYSDFYDVGYAYPWIRVPGDLYGWPINSYNGASFTYSDDLGDGTYKITVFGGEEKENDDRENAEIYYASTSNLLYWKDIIGTSVTYTYDWFDIRAVYMTNKSYGEANYGAAGGGSYIYQDNEKQKFVGLAFNVDYNDFLLKTEYNGFDIANNVFSSDAKLIGIGYRMGDVTPMFTYTRYDDSDPSFGEAASRLRSISVRWDFMKNTDLKMQYDIISDDADWADTSTLPVTEYQNFIGNTRSISVGVDYVF